MSRAPTQSRRCFVRGIGIMVLACTALCVTWEDAYSIDARLEKNRGVGVGFGKLLEGDQTLTITLHAPRDGWLIDESEPRDNAGDHAWKPADGITTDSEDHVRIVPVHVDLIAHRAGDNHGNAVSDEIEDAGAPKKYVVLTNNDWVLRPFSGTTAQHYYGQTLPCNMAQGNAAATPQGQTWIHLPSRN